MARLQGKGWASHSSNGQPRVVLGDDHDATLFRWWLDDEEALAFAVFEVADGRITRITDFWPAAVTTYS